MKMIFSLLLALGLVSASICTYAEDAVDLPGDQDMVESSGTGSAKTRALTGCRKGICLRTEDQCVPGCDPPDENNTIHGCSSCYSKKSVCVSWEEVCD
jgi:hypothetical protein